MKFTKQAVLGSVLALGLFSQTTIGLAEELQGQLNVTLRGSDSNGALTLENVADLSGVYNINTAVGLTGTLTKTGDIEISDTRTIPQPWNLSVEVKQPKERGTNVPLGAEAISFNIDTHGRDNLEAFHSSNVLSEEEVATKVLGGQFSQTIPANDISSDLTLDSAFNSKAKGVYQSTIIYTLTDDVTSRCQVTFNSDGGSDVESIEVDKYGKITAPENPTKADFNFLGWYEEGSGTPFDFSKPITKNTSLKAKWEAIVKYKVKFMNFEGSSEIASEVEVKPGEAVSIPEAPAQSNYYFLGWAETANATGGAANQSNDSGHPTLYTSSDTAGLSALSQADQRFIGYRLASTHQLENIQENKSLYAVYFKALGATGAADAGNPRAQEFILNNSVWRVLKADGNNRLALKANVLTTKEATGSGDTTAYPARFTDRTQFFNVSGENAYESNAGNTVYLKSAIDFYYNSLSDDVKGKVLSVSLNNPDFSTYTRTSEVVSGEGYFSGSGAYNNWNWGGAYKDKRFSTTIGGAKQAFALSYGDINKTMGLAGYTTSSLLDFTGSNQDTYWLRSPGEGYGNAGAVVGNDFNKNFSASFQPNFAKYARPALWLSAS